MKTGKEQTKKPNPLRLRGQSQKPKMKYFRNLVLKDSIISQRIKNYCPKQLTFATDHKQSLEKRSTEPSLQDLARMLTVQRSRLKGLREVTITVDTHEEANKDKTAALGIFKNLRQIQSLKVRFPNQSGETFTAFRTQIRNYLQKLKRLTLDLHLFNLNDQLLAGVGNMFGYSLTTLEFLKINMPQRNQLETTITTSGVQDLSIQIEKGLRSLRGLDLSFSYSPEVIDGKMLEAICQIQERLKTIQFLNLQFEDLIGNDSNAVEKLAMQKGNKTEGLQYFWLNFTSQSMDAAGLKAVKSMIERNIKSLKQLNLNFTSAMNDHYGDSIKDLVKSLKGLKALNLSLRQSFGFSDSQMNTLAIQLGLSCRALQHLSLDLKEGQISDGTLMILSHAVGTQMKGLQSLKLDLSGAPNITDKGVKILALQISRGLHSLEHLSLILGKGHPDFCAHSEGNWNRITGFGLLALAGMIEKGNLNRLKEFHLTYEEPSGYLFSSALNKLAEMIGEKLKNLEKLSLSLTSPVITDSLLTEFAIQIFVDEFPKLRQVSFVFPSCGQVTDLGFKAFDRIAAGSCINYNKLSLFSLRREVS